MPDTTETARLILAAESVGFRESQQRVTDLRQDLTLLQASYKAGSVNIDEYRQTGQRLQSELDHEVAALKEAEAAVKRYGDATKAATALAAQSQSRMGGLQQAITAAGYAMQDAASAGGGFQQKLSAISNNIPAIVAGLGVGGPWGLAIGAAISALAALGSNWESIWRFFQEKNPFPKGAVDIDGMRRELERAKDAMEKLQKNTSLTASEMSKYNDLRKTTVELEEKIAAAQERQQAIKKALEEKTPEQEKRGKEFQERTQGRFKENFEALYADMFQEAKEAAYEGGFVRGGAKEARAAMEAVTPQQVAKDTTDILLKAQEGQKQALDAIQHFVRGGGETARVLGPQLTGPTKKQVEELIKSGPEIEEQSLRELEQARKEQVEGARKASKDFQESQEAIATEEERLAKEIKDKTAEAEKKRIATIARRIGGGTLGEEAQDYAARVQEQKPGISDADLRAAVSRAVAAEVARRAPQLAPAERAGVTTAVTEQALAAAPEDVAARQARAARALPRQQQAEMAQGYAQEAQARGFNPQASAEIGRRASAAFARTGDLEGSFMEAIAGFQQVLMGMQQHQQRMQAGLARVQQGNAALRARQPTAQWEGGFH